MWKAEEQAERSELKFLLKLFSKSLQGRWCPVGTVQRLTESADEKGQRPTTLPLWRAAQERKLGKQRSAFPGRPSAWALHSRGLHPGQFAPWGGELRSRLCEPLTHVRGGSGLPSQSPNGASSPEGGAKSRLPLWGRCHAKGMTERAACQRLTRSCPRAGDEKMGELAGNPGFMRVWQLPQVRELPRKAAALSPRTASTPSREEVRKPA